MDQVLNISPWMRYKNKTNRIGKVFSEYAYIKVG